MPREDDETPSPRSCTSLYLPAAVEMRTERETQRCSACERARERSSGRHKGGKTIEFPIRAESLCPVIGTNKCMSDAHAGLSWR